ncbi:U3 small nucleolar RNA-associated protein 18 homolog isoform X2 [Glandiceps talaboti]
MLRRSIKRSLEKQNTKGVGQPQNEQGKDEKSKKFRTLGDSSEKNESEEMLEKLVLGGEQMIVEKLEKTSKKKKTKTDEISESSDSGRLHPLESKKPAWVDEDDEDVTIDLTAKRHEELAKINETVLSGTKIHQRLKSQFERAVGSTPSWARLKSERQADSDGYDDDEDDELLKHTGDYLTTSDKLPKGSLQIKQCTNANKEKPTQGKVQSVEFHPGAQVLLTAGFDQSLNFFQVDGRTNPKIQSVFLQRFPIHTAHFSADGGQVILASKQKYFYVYDMIAGKVIRIPDVIGIEEQHLPRFQVSPDGQYLVFLGSYGYLYVLSAKTREWIATLKMSGNLESAAFSDDGSKLYSHGDDGHVYIWDMRSQKCLNKFTDEGCIKGLSVSVAKHEQYIACGSQSGVVNIYDNTCLQKVEPQPLKAVLNLTTPVTHTKFNSTNEILAISSNFAKNAVKLVHVPSMTVFNNFPDFSTHIYTPTCLDFSPRSGYLAIGNNKGSALLYRLKHYSES